MKDLDALIAEAEADEVAARKALLAEGADAAHLDDIAADLAATHEPTLEQREIFARIYRGMVGARTGNAAEDLGQAWCLIESTYAFSRALRDKWLEAANNLIRVERILFVAHHGERRVFVDGDVFERKRPWAPSPKSCASRLSYWWTPAPSEHLRVSLDDALSRAQWRAASEDHRILQTMVLSGWFDGPEASRLTAPAFVEPSQLDQIVRKATFGSRDQETVPAMAPTTQTRFRREDCVPDDPS